MKCVHCILFASLFVLALSQRSPYAGKRPVGYPELQTTTTTANPLGNRFGNAATTERLPIEALGDRDLVNRLSKLPIDKQPFWYINWRALEEQRKSQQTYEQRPSPFANDPSSSVQGQRQMQFNPNQNGGRNQARF